MLSISKFKNSEKERLAYRKKVRTCSKHLATTLSTTFFIGYIVASILNISVLSLYCSIVGSILNALSFALGIWSLTDYFRQRDLNKRFGVEDTLGQKKLTKIYLDVIHSVLFLIGGITPILPFEPSIIHFVSTVFFILGYAAMAANIIRTMLSEPKVEKLNQGEEISK
ncbi:hypothetical protein [Wolbachia pipientis]|uniref:hypothetical protein n=1 Tax=Wolbachia pipientis TaxID=955 RepID=UPI0025A4CA20|nr:hypothetical protein [Wolbachia pipientis]MDM8335798.1 hypothetical protein [Wolbachia pipientis]